MASFVRHAAVAAGRNGTTTHTVAADGTGGSVVAGSAFTPIAGRFLLCLVDASVTSTTPTGWTLPTEGSEINNTGLYVFYRDADGTSADQVVTTHNASNYPAIFDFYEFAAGSTWNGVASSGSIDANGGAGPTASGLTGTNWTAGVVGQANANAGLDSFTWNLGVEAVDTSEGASGTDGYTYSLTFEADNPASSAAYAATGSDIGTSVQRLVVVVNAVEEESAPGVFIEFTKVI